MGKQWLDIHTDLIDATRKIRAARDIILRLNAQDGMGIPSNSISHLLQIDEWLQNASASVLQEIEAELNGGEHTP